METTDSTRVLDGTIEHNWEHHYKLNPGDVFVEIGGFWGRYGVVASRDRKALAIMVEPSPYNVEKIRQAMREENAPDVKILQCAVSDRRGESDFVIWGNPSGNRLRVGEEYPDDSIKVATDTTEGILDQCQILFGIDHVDLLAADCEGAERVLAAHLGKWANKIKHFAIGAYHHPDNPRIVGKTLLAYGCRNISYEDYVVYADGE